MLLAPAVKLLTADVAEVVVVTNAVPAITLHDPDPIVAVFALSALDVVLHNVWSVPAAAVVGNASTIIATSSVDAGQKPLLIVHRNVAVLPMLIPVTPDVLSVAVVTVAVPLITLHAPTPTVAVFAAKVAVLRLQKF